MKLSAGRQWFDVRKFIKFFLSIEKLLIAIITTNCPYRTLFFVIALVPQ